MAIDNAKKDEKSQGSIGYHNHYQGGFWGVIVFAVIVVFVMGFGLMLLGMFGNGRTYPGMGYYPGYMMHDHNGFSHNLTSRYSAQTFGTITSINANNITITDNSAQSQTVISSSGTTILSAGILEPLSFLKSGQNIQAYGTVNSNNQLAATLIRVVGP